MSRDVSPDGQYGSVVQGRTVYTQGGTGVYIPGWYRCTYPGGVHTQHVSRVVYTQHVSRVVYTQHGSHGGPYPAWLYGWSIPSMTLTGVPFPGLTPEESDGDEAPLV